MEEEEEEDEEEEEEEEKPPSKEKNPKRRSKRIRQLEKKKTEDVTEEEWMEMAREQEKEMRKRDGTYYNTKYKLKDKVQVKLAGWDGLKEGKIVKVHKNKKRRLVKYDVKLNKKYKGKQLYKNSV